MRLRMRLARVEEMGRCCVWDGEIRCSEATAAHMIPVEGCSFPRRLAAKISDFPAHDPLGDLSADSHTVREDTD